MKRTSPEHGGAPSPTWIAVPSRIAFLLACLLTGGCASVEASSPETPAIAKWSMPSHHDEMPVAETRLEESIRPRTGLEWEQLKEAEGEGEEAADEEWKYAVTPYLWALSIKGHATVQGSKSEVDASFSDILDELNFGFFIHQEVRKGRHGALLDIFVASIQSETDETIPGGPPPGSGPTTISIDSDVFILLAEADYIYVLDEERAIDVFAGARWTYQRIKVRPSPGIPNSRKSKSWIDPVVGMRKTWTINEKTKFRIRGDVGGMGFKDQNSWQVLGGWNRQVSERGSIDIAARVLSQDYKDGSGDSEYRWNARMVGLLLGYKFRF